MLAVRIIASLTFNEGRLYRTKKFHPDYLYTNSQVDFWDVDEVFVIDITRGKRGDLGPLKSLRERAFVPIAAGGGISSWDDIRKVMEWGADKVVVNTAALENPEFITTIAARLGSQSVTLSIDYRDNKVFKNCGSEETGWTPAGWAREGVERGAGEILLTSMDRDGGLTGYDLDASGEVADAVNVPVVFSGGAGNWKHFEEGLNNGAHGVATQCIYHFTSNSMKAAKTYLGEKGFPVRL